MTEVDPWADDQIAELVPCIACEKATKSHLLLVVFDDELKRIVPLDDGVDGQTIGLPLCHSCYSIDGVDAARLARLYDDELRETLDDHGLTPTELFDDDVDDDVAASAIELSIDLDSYEELPDHVVEALPDSTIESPATSAKMLRYEYEERYLDITFEERDCDDCGESTDHRVEVDTFRRIESTECSNCNHKTTTEYDTDS